MRSFRVNHLVVTPDRETPHLHRARTTAGPRIRCKGGSQEGHQGGSLAGPEAELGKARSP